MSPLSTTRQLARSAAYALVRAAALLAGSIGMTAPSRAQLIQVSQLKDVTFGTVATTTGDVSRSQSICVEIIFSSVNRYSVTAIGSGPGGTLALSNGTSVLPYEVQWGETSGQTSGTALVAGRATGSFAGGSCFFGLITSASLVTVLRASALNNAVAGSYSGNLTLLVAPQ